MLPEGVAYGRAAGGVGHGRDPQPDAPFSMHDGIIGSAPVPPCQNTGLYILGHGAGTDGAISRHGGAVSVSA